MSELNPTDNDFYDVYLLHRIDDDGAPMQKVETNFSSLEHDLLETLIDNLTVDTTKPLEGKNK